MKKIVPCLLALILLLSACHHESQTPFIPDTGDNPQQGAVQNPDKNPNDKDTDTDNKEDQEQDQEREKEELQRLAECLLTERKTLSYAEFFSEDRMYALDGGHGRYDWAVVSEDGMRLFEATRRLNAKEYCVTSYDGGEKYNIPGTSAYVKDYEMFSADGVYAYFKNSKEIVQLEMRTGTARQIVQSDYISDAYICGRDALYYAAVKDGKLAVNRLYIPTMQLDVLYDGFSEGVSPFPGEFALYEPQSTQGDVIWQTINPAMLAQAQKEIKNPESKYNVADEGMYVHKLWETDDPWGEEMVRLRQWLYYLIQKDTGIRTFLKGTSNQASGAYSERLGIIDDCWFGSGFPHDHYSPEITEKEEPVLNIGQWVSIPDLQKIQQEDTVRVYADQFMPYTLYRYANGKLQEKLTDAAVTGAASFCVTEDNKLLQFGDNGTVCNTLYQGQHKIRGLERYGKDVIYFMDGDTLVELNMANGKYRTILTHTGIKDLYVEEENEDRPSVILVDVAEGLFYRRYVYDIATGKNMYA